MPKSDLITPAAAKLSRKLDKSQDPDSCWNWTGGVNLHGYGMASFDGLHRLVHRVAWEESNGTIPAGMCVLHKCDNRRCANPAHLFLGTRKDNYYDAKAKGRLRHRMGISSPRATLTDSDVCTLRARYAAGGVSYRQLSLEYGVSRSSVAGIIRGRRRQRPSSTDFGPKTTPERVNEILAMRGQGATYLDLVSHFGLGLSTIARIVKGNAWGNVKVEA